MTEWRICIGAPNYQVSDAGQVRRYPRGNILKPSTVCGYWQVVLMIDRKRVTRRVHRLIAEAFIGLQPSPNHQVAHWDGNRKNNNFANLRWATPHENTEDKLRHGTMHVMTWNSKLTPEKVRDIRSQVGAGRTQSEVARQYGVQASHVNKIVRGLKWRQLEAA